jgi:hypothetical protein
LAVGTAKIVMRNEANAAVYELRLRLGGLARRAEEIERTRESQFRQALELGARPADGVVVVVCYVCLSQFINFFTYSQCYVSRSKKTHLSFKREVFWFSS